MKHFQTMPTAIATALLALVGSAPASAQSGRIFAAHDVNTLSTSVAGPEEVTYAVNLATWLVGSSSGSILAIQSGTDAFRDYSVDVRNALASAGFQVTHTASYSWTLAQLQVHDAVFVGISFPSALFLDPDVLAQYVQGGGSVYVFGGVGNSAVGEASILNPFVSQFGLMYDSLYNGLISSPICSLHPVLEGVTSLGSGNGQTLRELGTTPFTRGVERVLDGVLYALYDPAFQPLAPSYCPAVANSTGSPAILDGWGSASTAANSLRLVASALPANQFGYFLASRTQGLIVMPGGSRGNLCIVGAIGRFNAQIQNSGLFGTFCIDVDLTSVPQPVGSVAVQVGETWNFQCWYRDNDPGPTSNFTDAVTMTFL
ncbi:MAG: hypothetical protein GY711_30770 [bacterium]|nr:hypothetical protein [bacterium]